MNVRDMRIRGCGLLLSVLLLTGCGGLQSRSVYFNPNMDFSSVQAVAVMPFENLTTDEHAVERVRDAFMGMLLATDAMYVLPTGEVLRGINRVGLRNPEAPTTEQIKALSGVLNVQAVIVGVLREYGAVRSGTATSNVVSLSLQMIETESGAVVWSASSTKGGISMADRLIGGGGQPMNKVTEDVIDDLLDQLFQ
ncbi:MAG TPA: hypothetical protein VGA63_13855 [Geopsychrobacteraceae bacterium]|jgi:hypothetical protein